MQTCTPLTEGCKSLVVPAGCRARYCLHECIKEDATLPVLTYASLGLPGRIFRQLQLGKLLTTVHAAIPTEMAQSLGTSPMEHNAAQQNHKSPGQGHRA